MKEALNYRLQARVPDRVGRALEEKASELKLKVSDITRHALLYFLFGEDLLGIAAPENSDTNGHPTPTQEVT